MGAVKWLVSIIALLLVPALAQAADGSAHAAPTISMAVPEDQSLSVPEPQDEEDAPGEFSPHGFDADIVIERAIIRNDESYKDIILIWT